MSRVKLPTGRGLLLAAAALLLAPAVGRAALIRAIPEGTPGPNVIVNPPQTITDRINVAIIQVADDSGNNAAPLWGDAAQTAAVFDKVDQIWAQAGIDVDFIQFRTVAASAPYFSTFALTGTPGSNNPRPTGDLDTIVDNATNGGVAHPDPNTLNLFVTRIVPGFSQTSDNTSNGLAFVGGNGMTYWAGPNLPGFDGGREALASVLAHEIGHNMGLDHIDEAENLMQAGGSPNQGERLNATQIQTALDSPFSVPIPEPVGAAATLVALAVAGGLRRRGSAAA